MRKWWDLLRLAWRYRVVQSDNLDLIVTFVGTAWFVLAGIALATEHGILFCACVAVTIACWFPCYRIARKHRRSR